MLVSIDNSKSLKDHISIIIGAFTTRFCFICNKISIVALNVAASEQLLKWQLVTYTYLLKDASNLWHNLMQDVGFPELCINLAS